MKRARIANTIANTPPAIRIFAITLVCYFTPELFGLHHILEGRRTHVVEDAYDDNHFDKVKEVRRGKRASKF